MAALHETQNSVLGALRHRSHDGDPTIRPPGDYVFQSFDVQIELKKLETPKISDGKYPPQLETLSDEVQKFYQEKGLRVDRPGYYDYNLGGRGGIKLRLKVHLDLPANAELAAVDSQLEKVHATSQALMDAARGARMTGNSGRAVG